MLFNEVLQNLPIKKVGLITLRMSKFKILNSYLWLIHSDFLLYCLNFYFWDLRNWIFLTSVALKNLNSRPKSSNFGFLNFKYALKTRHWADNLKNIVLYLACYFWFLLIKMSVMFLLASIWLPLLCSWRTHVLWLRLQSFKLSDHP